MKKINADPRLPQVGTGLPYFQQLNARLYELFRTIANSINDGVDGFLFSVSTQTGDYTLNKGDQVIIVKNTANCVITLPSADETEGKRFIVKKAINNAFTVTIQAASGNIDNSATFVITTAYTSVDMVSDGTDYWVV